MKGELGQWSARKLIVRIYQREQGVLSPPYLHQPPPQSSLSILPSYRSAAVSGDSLG